MYRNEMKDKLEPDRPGLVKIISGGQTGVDRGALRAAHESGLETGGFCPRGRRAEDGPIPEEFPMTELVSSSYDVRTRMNVGASDATLIISPLPLRGGTRLTRMVANKAGRPCLVLEAGKRDSVRTIVEWLTTHRPAVLNVAGPRASAWPEAERTTFDLLLAVLDAYSGSQ